MLPNVYYRGAQTILFIYLLFIIYSLIYINIYNRYVPDEIAGDLDSLRADVREFYESMVKF